MSAIVNTKRAIERRLQASFPSLKIAFEGVNFKPPANELYLICNFKVNKPTDPTLGREYYRESITANIFVCDVLNKGTSNAFAKAEEIRGYFDKGLTLTESSTVIHILSTPQISGSTVTNDRVVVPLMITCTVEVLRN